MTVFDKRNIRCTGTRLECQRKLLVNICWSILDNLHIHIGMKLLEFIQHTTVCQCVMGSFPHPDRDFARKLISLRWGICCCWHFCRWLLGCRRRFCESWCFCGGRFSRDGSSTCSQEHRRYYEQEHKGLQTKHDLLSFSICIGSFLQRIRYDIIRKARLTLGCQGSSAQPGSACPEMSSRRASTSFA